MSKNFAKSKNYPRLLEQLRVGKRAACVGIHSSSISAPSPVAFMLDFDAKTGILASQGYFRKPEILDDEQFFAACKRLDLEFFDEAEAPKLPEPDMFWPMYDADVNAMDLQHLIDEAEECGDLLEVNCAKSLPSRKIRAWRNGKDESEDEKQHWEWVD